MALVLLIGQPSLMEGYGRQMKTEWLEPVWMTLDGEPSSSRERRGEDGATKSIGDGWQEIKYASPLADGTAAD